MYLIIQDQIPIGFFIFKPDAQFALWKFLKKGVIVNDETRF